MATTPTPKPFYRSVRCSEALQLVEALSPTSEEFRVGDWIFRGQGHDLALLPTAYREDEMRPRKGLAWNDWTYLNQAKAELTLIRNFFRTADRAGLPIPEDSYDVRCLLEDIDSNKQVFVRDWPPGRLWGLMALAQHHRVPTRLLGWSESPWVAAYFAAETVLRCEAMKRADCKIVVWAFDASMANAILDESEDAEQKPVGIVEIVTTPYANNRNLAAQRGIHLLYRPTVTPRPKGTVQRDPFDDALQHVHASVRDYAKALYKLTLPATAAGDLLWLVEKHGITGATMFPGYDGVVRGMWERDQW